MNRLASRAMLMASMMTASASLMSVEAPSAKRRSYPKPIKPKRHKKEKVYQVGGHGYFNGFRP